MPILDGFEMATEIRRIQFSKRMSRSPIIVIIGNPFLEEADQLYAADMDECLSKPVKLEVLGDVLGEWHPTKKAKTPLVK
jgi:CheY-like chemotaxis protein